MRYESQQDLPEALQDVLPEEAQKLYLEVYQEAWDSYEEEEGGELSRDGVAHRQAMHAVRSNFVQAKDGKWYRKGETPEEEEEGESADLQALDDLGETL
jgi:cation transport regulator ChaB